MRMPDPTTSSRAATTRAALLDAATAEFSAFGFRRSSMESIARRAGVSRATLYLHWSGKTELLRGLVEQLHADHIAAMEQALADRDRPLEQRLVAMLEARFVRFVRLTSASPHAAELYDLHSRMCGDIARASQQRSEQLLERLIRDAVADREIDLERIGLSAPKLAGVLFDCAHGAKGEDPSLATPEEFQQRLHRVVHVLVVGLAPAR